MSESSRYRSSLFFKFRSYLHLLASFCLGRWSVNGSNRLLTLGTVFEKYKDLHLPTVSEITRIKLIARVERYLAPLFDESMGNLTPDRIAEFIKSMKLSYVQGPYSKRYNFNKELRDLRALLQWWSDHYDYRFKNPIKQFHFKLGVMEEVPEKDKKISMDETIDFFNAFPQKSLYHDLAVTQYYCGGRTSEIVGIQIKNIDLENRVLSIKEVIVWIRGKPKIKALPKNGKARAVFINDTLYEIFSRRMKDTHEGCVFLFHDESNHPIRYNRVNVAFNKAWKDAGLSQKFSGSHLLRYSSSQAARKITGSLDAAAAVTGHLSMRMAAHYGKLDSTELNQSSVKEIEKHMNQLGKKRRLGQKPELESTA